MEGMTIVPIFLHLYSNAGTTTLSQFYTYASFLVPTMWNFSWRKTLSLDVTVFFLIYMDKLVCRNNDMNKEAIREQYILGRDGGGNYGENFGIGRNCDK